jgi:hypothetical protein
MPRGKSKKKSDKKQKDRVEEPKKDEKKPVEVPETPEIDENLAQKEEKEPEIKPEPQKIPEPIKPKPEPPPENNGIVLDREMYSLDEAARFLGIQSITAKLWFEHGHLSGVDDRGLRMASKASILAVQGSNFMNSER